MCVYVSKSRYYFYEEIAFCLRILDNVKTSVDEKEKEKKKLETDTSCFCIACISISCSGEYCGFVAIISY
jgi:hypothetical protein